MNTEEIEKACISLAIKFLNSSKYDNKAWVEERIELDKKIDQICLLLNSYVKRPPRTVLDADCPGGVCGTGGREG